MAHLDDATYKKQVRAVWVATAIMGVITILEVAIALFVHFNYPEFPRMALNSMFILMSIAKAYFIVAEFMHVKYEKRALILSIIGPTFFLIWFIIAFLWEGGAWLQARQIWEVIAN